MQVFLDLDFTLLEMNPFTIDPSGMPFPLDMRGELDDTAAFKSGKKWGDLEFPLPFGRTMTSAEEHVHGLDSTTGELTGQALQRFLKASVSYLLKFCLFVLTAYLETQQHAGKHTNISH